MGPTMQEAIHRGNWVQVEYLIRTQGTHHHINDNHYTPLHQASSQGKVEIVEWLLKKGYYAIYAKDLDGWTALHHAAAFDHYRTVKKLLAKGADPTTTNKQNQTAVKLTSSNKIQRLLWASMYDPKKSVPKMENWLSQQGSGEDDYIPESLVDLVKQGHDKNKSGPVEKLTLKEALTRTNHQQEKKATEDKNKIDNLEWRLHRLEQEQNMGGYRANSNPQSNQETKEEDCSSGIPTELDEQLGSEQKLAQNKESGVSNGKEAVYPSKRHVSRKNRRRSKSLPCSNKGRDPPDFRWDQTSDRIQNLDWRLQRLKQEMDQGEAGAPVAPPAGSGNGKGPDDGDERRKKKKKREEEECRKKKKREEDERSRRRRQDEEDKKKQEDKKKRERDQKKKEEERRKEQEEKRREDQRKRREDERKRQEDERKRQEDQRRREEAQRRRDEDDYHHSRYGC